MLRGGVRPAEVLDELESHLREDIERKMKSGLSEQPAFDSAIQQIGNAAALKPEFKNGKAKEEHAVSIALAAAACLVSLYGGGFVIYWSVIDLQTPPGEKYRAVALGCFLLGTVMVLSASYAEFLCIKNLMKRRALKLK
ncbi:MAG TPA: permease prefix domain 1-containing protein [Verrucomicrobiae bacterium]|nr:permease prefix domain 1-containing protein [Verrucomicrobiae bacterium]